MKLREIQIHNFRSIIDARIEVSNYGLLIGSNNSGKSNVIDAIRLFYSQYTYSRETDFPKTGASDDQVWLELEFELTDEEALSLKDDYPQPDKSLRVRKIVNPGTGKLADSRKPGIYAYVESELSDQLFYGAKNVQQGKFGELVCIPAVSKLDDHTKFSGPSELRELVNRIMKSLVESSDSFQKIRESFGKLVPKLKEEQSNEGHSLAKLESDISDQLSRWDTEFRFNISAPSDSDVIKSLISYEIFDQSLDQGIDPSRFGHGFQRQLIYTVITLGAQYQGNKQANGEAKKDFRPDYTLILYEEPEAYLHPTQQVALDRSLRSLSNSPQVQVVCTSHSPVFVSQNCDLLYSMARLRRDDGVSRVGQVPKTFITDIFEDNQRIFEILDGEA